MVVYLFYILFAILPLIFFPKTSEVFEFNKIVVLYIFSVLITASWIIKMIQAKKIIFKRTLLDIPLLIFLGSQLISTVFSIDTRTSLFGYYGRFNGGLISLVCYVLLYFAFVSNFNKQTSLKLIKITLVSAVIVSIYGILEHFGGSISCVFVIGKFTNDCWVQDVQQRVFATLGQPNWLAAMLVGIMPLALANVLTQKQKKTKIIYIIISVLFLACILFTKSRSGLLGLVTALIIFGIFNFKKYFKELAIIAVLFGSVISIFGTPWTPKISDLINKQEVKQEIDTSEGGTESGNIRAIVWKGAIDVWKHNLIIGTGVETFAFSYWQYRPIEHNNTSEWDFLYNKAHNEYLNILANSGIIGLGSYLFLVIASIYQIVKSNKLKVALLAGYISILITNFFGFSVVNTSMLAFIMPALSITLKTKQEKNRQTSINSNQKIWIGSIVLMSLFILFLIIKYWQADYLFNLGRQSYTLGKYEESISNLQNASKNSPGEAIYHNELARVFTNITDGLINENYATDAAKFASLALSESDKAFDLSPRNMNIRETRVNTFLQLSQLKPSYLQAAIDLTNDTILLSPTDPKLYVALGKAYANLGEFEKSKEAFGKALELKPDYSEAKKDLEIIENLEK